MTKKNPNNPYPKKTEAAAKATAAMARKNHHKFIYSCRYVMKNMPSPCLSTRSVEYQPHVFPKQVGLVSKERQLSSRDVLMLTMSIVTRNGNHTNTWQKYAYVQSFLKALKPYLPDGVRINSDWANLRTYNCSDPKMDEMAREFEEFVDQYMHDIETKLAMLYVELGDKSGKQYLEVLQRKFRISGWNLNPTTVRFNASVNQKENPTEAEDTEEKPKDTSVTFNFEVVGAQPSEG